MKRYPYTPNQTYSGYKEKSFAMIGRDTRDLIALVNAQSLTKEDKIEVLRHVKLSVNKALKQLEQ